ncbi:ATP-binding protein [Candidatus Daviesbacteria bacterium]|nr:ATP-binding protein [Candidatus Daviesbacteria bacterium]
MIDFHQLEAGYLLNKYSPSLFHAKDNLINSFLHSPFLLIILSVLAILFITFLVVRRILIIKRSVKERSILLELTPPVFTEKSAYTTQQLFSVIHNLGERRSFWDKLLGRKTIFSFEIVSSLNQGIRYLIRTTPEEVNNVKRSLLSYLPQVSVKTVNEYLPENINKLDKFQSKVIEFKLRKHFAYPLQKQDILKEHDPVAYITGMMTKLSPGELISFQIVLSPTKSGESNKLSQMILNNEDVLSYLNKLQAPGYIKPISIILKLFAKFISLIGSQAQWAVTELMNGSNKNYVLARQYELHQQSLIATHTKPARILSSFEQEAISSIQGKIDQSLFEASIRFLVIMKDKNDLNERNKGFISSLATFSVPKYQSLNIKSNFPAVLIDKVRLLNFRKRLLSLFSNESSVLLSVSEVADLYHFPSSRVTQTEDIVKVHSKELPAPLSLKKGRELAVIFGKNSYAGSETQIGLTEEERKTHMYIIGRTGSGKTTLMFSMAKHDIESNQGLAFIDPHGDVSEDLLASVPEARKDDLIYLNPFDLKYPIGINLLELTPNLDEDEAELEKEVVAEGVVSLFRKVFSKEENANAHRIEYILRNTIHTAFTTENPTIFTLYDLLNNPPFQKQVVSRLQDENLKNFWKFEFGRAGDYQVVKMVGGVTAKIGRFLFSPTAKSKEKINPFDFSLTTLGEENELAEHIQDLTEIISLMVGGLNAEEKAAVDKAILQTYKDHGWLLNYSYTPKKHRDPRGRKVKAKTYPLLKDFYKVLKTMNQKKLCARLEKFIKGSLSSVFDCQTNIKLNNRLVIFDIKDLNESIRQIMMLVVANFVNNQVKSNPQKRILIIDEGWMLLQHEESARFIAGLTRRARKYYLGVTIISQQANDFLSQDYGRVIASQSALRILMKQDTTTIKKVASEFNLSEYEQHFLLTCDRGEALIIADQNHVALKVVASEKEHPLLTTDPREIYL